MSSITGQPGSGFLSTSMCLEVRNACAGCIEDLKHLCRLLKIAFMPLYRNATGMPDLMQKFAHAPSISKRDQLVSIHVDDAVAQAILLLVMPGACAT